MARRGEGRAIFGQRTKANVVSSNHDTIKHFILSARVPDVLENLGIIVDNDLDVTTTIALVSKSFQGFNDGNIPTFIDSGASDTMFILRSDFNNYKSLPPHSGDSAKAIDGDFEIIGKGTVVKRYLVDGKEKKLTYTCAIHTPTLNVNLISVSAIDRAGLTVTFGGGRGVVRKTDGTAILTA